MAAGFAVPPRVQLAAFRAGAHVRRPHAGERAAAIGRPRAPVPLAPQASLRPSRGSPCASTSVCASSVCPCVCARARVFGFGRSRCRQRQSGSSTSRRAPKTSSWRRRLCASDAPDRPRRAAERSREQRNRGAPLLSVDWAVVAGISVGPLAWIGNEFSDAGCGRACCRHR